MVGHRLVVEMQYQAGIAWVNLSERMRVTTRSTWRPSMNIKPIRNDDDLRAAFARLEAVFQAPEGSPEADEMEVLVALVESYEDKHYPVGPADPVEAIKFRMEQQGLAAKDLEPYIGSSGRVSEVLNRKRALSLRMIKRLHDGLNIPYESLLSGAG
jgi:HTH-type transcriptional regulator / antitoxin HigA